jgi:hypothetical protein
MFDRGGFLIGKAFHSIVVLVPLHVSKFYRVLKKLTASFTGRGPFIRGNALRRQVILAIRLNTFRLEYTTN